MQNYYIIFIERHSEKNHFLSDASEFIDQNVFNDLSTALFVPLHSETS